MEFNCLPRLQEHLSGGNEGVANVAFSLFPLGVTLAGVVKTSRAQARILGYHCLITFIIKRLSDPESKFTLLPPPKPADTNQQHERVACTVCNNMISHHVLLCSMVYTAHEQGSAVAAVKASKACKGPADYQLINVRPWGCMWSSSQPQSASASKTQPRANVRTDVRACRADWSGAGH